MRTGGQNAHGRKESSAGKTRTLAVYVGPHLAFTKFSEAIGATPYKIVSRVQKTQPLPLKGASYVQSVLSIPKGYDVYFAENCYYYPVAARKLGLIGGKIVNVCASGLYYDLANGRHGAFERNLLISLAKEVDLFVLEGKYVGGLLKRMGVEKPMCLSYTYVSPERYPVLKKMEPQLESKEVTIIATNDYLYKGVDIVLEAMKIVCAKDPQARLNLVLGNIDQRKIRHLLFPAVRISYEAMPALSSASLYVHPARGDTFPMGPLEAMLGGIPTIVSEQTGTCEVVEKVKKEYVIPLNAQVLAERILEYFGMSPSERQKLSARFRQAALPFNEKQQVSFFKREYEKAMRKIMG
ncbi:MAG: glycosyltransferase family 4 protein [Candidatus Micrarchaeota archaeon]|nr:glycosyltransferase family 4 protein [Candidatus Micrarchaeota archaeon]